MTILESLPTCLYCVLEAGILLVALCQSVELPVTPSEEYTSIVGGLVVIMSVRFRCD